MSMHYTYEEAAKTVHTSIAEVKKYDTNNSKIIGDTWSEESAFTKFWNNLEEEAKAAGNKGDDQANLNSYSLQRNYVQTLSSENNAVDEYNKAMETYLNNDSTSQTWNSSYDVKIGDGTKYISGSDILGGNRTEGCNDFVNMRDLSSVTADVQKSYNICKITDADNNCDITVQGRKVKTNSDGSYDVIFCIDTQHGSYTTPVQTLKGEMTEDKVKELIKNTNFYDTSKSDEVKTPEIETGFEETPSTTVTRKAVKKSGPWQYAAAYTDPGTGKTMPTSGNEFKELCTLFKDNKDGTVNLPEKIGTYELYSGDLNTVVAQGKDGENNGTVQGGTSASSEIETTSGGVRGYVVDKDGNKHYTESYANKADAEKAVNNMIEIMKQQGLV